MLRRFAIVLSLGIAACGGDSGGSDGGTPPGNTGATGDSLHLYVLSQFSKAVFVYDIAADGSFKGPSRTITGPTTGITNPTSMIVDALGAVYVVNYETNVVVFSPGAAGDATPMRTFATDVFPVYIARNGSTSYALIGNRAKGDASQATTYLGSVYPTNGPGSYVQTDMPFIVPNQRSIATSPQPNIVGWSVWTCSGVQSGSSNGSATCYGNPVTSTQAGYVSSPQFTIPASPNALTFGADGTLVIANQMVYMQSSNIATWALPGEGATIPPAVPLRAIKGASTGLVSPVGIYVDAETETIYVADTGNASFQGTIKTWPINADGDVPPTHVISGLNYPFAVAVSAK